MRPKRPHIVTLNQVRIRRTGESAVVEYLDPAILPVVISVGPDADRLSDAEILDRHNAHLREAEALTKGRQHIVVEIPPGRRQIEYSVAGGQWVPRGGVLRCLIDEHPAVHADAARRHRGERPAASGQRPAVVASPSRPSGPAAPVARSRCPGHSSRAEDGRPAR